MDILTEFCSSSDEVKVYRLSFSEYYYATGIDKFEDWDESHIYGGMPFLLEKQTSKQKSRYLEYVINKVYISDI